MLLVVILVISAFTHLWNIGGFPSIYRDEDHYLRKTLHVLNGFGPQEKPDELLSNPLHPYTHPYFGQLFLATILGGIGYPDSIHPSVDPSSIKELFVVPRILMGLLAVLDTFLLFKIVERRYDTTTAVASSVLFAVMPITWILRRVWLEPIQLPFLLGSILIALYIKDCKKGKTLPILVAFSGILFGLAIFTKIPIFSLMPLVLYIIYSNSKKWKLVGLWLLPVLLIPLTWPLFAILNGEYDQWIDGLLWQSGRENMGITAALGKIFSVDPVLLSITLIGTLYAIVLRRDLFIILWILPFILLSLIIGFVSYWHVIPIFPAFCIASAILIKDTSKLLRNNKYRKVLPYTVILVLGAYGLIVNTSLMTQNLTSFHYQVISDIAYQIQEANKNATGLSSEKKFNKSGVTVLGTNYWLWIPKYIFDKNNLNEYRNYYNAGDNITSKYLFVVGENFIRDMTRDNHTTFNVKTLRQLLTKSDLLTIREDNQSNIVDRNKFPLKTMIELEPKTSAKIEIHSNY